MLHAQPKTLARFRSPLPSASPFTGPSGALPGEAQAAERMVAQGIEAARAGRRAEALHLLDQALRIHHDHLEALLWRGGLSEPAEALSYLERAYVIDPGNRRARAGLEWARKRLGLANHPAATTQPDSTPPPMLTPAKAQPGARRQAGKRHLKGILLNTLLLLAERPLVTVVTIILLLTVLGAASLGQDGFNNDVLAPLPTVQVVSPTTSVAPAGGVVAQPAAGAVASALAEPTVTPSPTPTSSPTPGGPSALDLAWSAEDWPQVITLVEEMLKDRPTDAELTEKLFAAHFNYGVQLVRTERLAEAVAEFERALTINVGDLRAEGERKRAQLYREGSTALSAGDFAAAIAPLRALYDSHPAYGSVKARLYQAYIGYAAALEESGKKTEAYLTYQKASKVDAQGTEAQAGLARLKPPTPTPRPPTQSAAGKKIEVDIAKQQVIVWENGKVLWRFKASTGKAPYLTRKGNFKIQSKMPNAYSSAMLWGMPWWMGIYYAGKWENGFHAMARVGKAQTVLPESVLGRPATHGCIMLSDKDAKTLYDWAVIGTPVWIH